MAAAISRFQDGRWRDAAADSLVLERAAVIRWQLPGPGGRDWQFTLTNSGGSASAELTVTLSGAGFTKAADACYFFGSRWHPACSPDRPLNAVDVKTRRNRPNDSAGKQDHQPRARIANTG
jgi:hypothetical protein